MTDQRTFDAWVQSQRDVRSLSQRDLTTWWRKRTPSQLQTDARRMMAQISTVYGEVSATQAAAFYEDARADAVSGRFTARMPKSIGAVIVASHFGDVAKALEEQGAEAALKIALAVVDQASLADGRRLIADNAARDPKRAKWARVPVGKTCAWCLMLASRSGRYLYNSAATAGAFIAFHGKCDCQPVPTWNGGADLPPSWHESDHLTVYETAVKNAGTRSDTSAILREIRRLSNGSLVTDGVTSQHA